MFVGRTSLPEPNIIEARYLEGFCDDALRNKRYVFIFLGVSKLTTIITYDVSLWYLNGISMDFTFSNYSRERCKAHNISKQQQQQQQQQQQEEK